MRDPQAMAGFLSLHDVVVAPPFPALIAVVIASGIVALGLQIARWCRAGIPTATEAFAGVVLSTGLVGTVAHGLAWSRFSLLLVLRGLAILLSVYGGVELIRRFRSIFEKLRSLLVGFRGASRSERILWTLIVTSLCGLALAALGPATDADSLAYHLGVPLDWLRNGGIERRTDWMHTRLIGLGEAVDLLGLAAGSDGLGAVFQWIGAIGIGVALRSFAKERSAHVLAWLLIATTPVVLFLIPNQKFQLFPVAATTVALSIIIRNYDRLSRRDVILVVGCLVFAVGCKLSFLFSASAIAIVGIRAAVRSRMLITSMLVGVACCCVLVAPLLFQRWLDFGDPFSPAFERLKSNPDPRIIAFGRMLHTYVHPHTWLGVAKLLREVIVPNGPSTFSTALGLGAFAFLAVRTNTQEGRLLVGTSLLTTVLAIGFGSLEPRYLLEPYLWLGAAAVAAFPSVLTVWLTRGLLVQGALVASSAWLGAVSIFPGAICTTWRKTVLLRHASGYAESRWLDEILPKNAIVVTTSRFAALAPRSFVIWEPQYEGNQWQTVLLSRMKAAHVNTLVIPHLYYERRLKSLFGECGKRPLSNSFSLATRNPLRDKRTYTIDVIDVSSCW